MGRMARLVLWQARGLLPIGLLGQLPLLCRRYSWTRKVVMLRGDQRQPKLSRVETPVTGLTPLARSHSSDT